MTLDYKKDETRNYLLEEIKHNDLMSQTFTFFFVSTVSVCASIFAFTSLVGVPVGIASSAVGLKICAVTARIKVYKSTIMKKRKVHDKKSVPKES